MQAIPISKLTRSPTSLDSTVTSTNLRGLMQPPASPQGAYRMSAARGSGNSGSGHTQEAP
eukprot:526827-Prymnesium_polylepis.2